jgi:two-component system repressor protein LuxO
MPSISEAFQPGSSDPIGLLVIDRDEAGSSALLSALQARLTAQSAAHSVSSGREALEALRSQQFDIVLADLASIADLSPKGDDAVGKVARLSSGALVLVFLDAASVSTSMGVMRAGAHECIAKPVSGEALALRIGALALRLGRLRALVIVAPALPEQ